ncbi:unnamed protein product, partial [Iphiclides podalirius]
MTFLSPPPSTVLSEPHPRAFRAPTRDECEWGIMKRERSSPVAPSITTANIVALPSRLFGNIYLPVGWSVADATLRGHHTVRSEGPRYAADTLSGNSFVIGAHSPKAESRLTLFAKAVLSVLPLLFLMPVEQRDKTAAILSPLHSSRTRLPLDKGCRIPYVVPLNYIIDMVSPLPRRLDSADFGICSGFGVAPSGVTHLEGHSAPAAAARICRHRTITALVNALHSDGSIFTLMPTVQVAQLNRDTLMGSLEAAPRPGLKPPTPRRQAQDAIRVVIVERAARGGATIKAKTPPRGAYEGTDRVPLGTARRRT